MTRVIGPRVSREIGPRVSREIGPRVSREIGPRVSREIGPRVSRVGWAAHEDPQAADMQCAAATSARARLLDQV